MFGWQGLLGSFSMVNMEHFNNVEDMMEVSKVLVGYLKNVTLVCLYLIEMSWKCFPFESSFFRLEFGGYKFCVLSITCWQYEIADN